MTTRRLAVTATGVALAAVLTACGSSSGTGSHDSGMAGMSSSTASSAGAASPSAGSDAAASRDGDVTFAQSMIPHHEQAIEMADLALKSASSAEVKQLATQIKAAQDPEIRTMQGWLSSWGASEDMGMDHSEHGMPGMMSEADLGKLAAASGKDFDTRWLQMMIAHHQGALTMANDVLATTQDAAVTTLAQAVVAGQTKEIDAMKALLAG